MLNAFRMVISGLLVAVVLVSCSGESDSAAMVEWEESASAESVSFDSSYGNARMASKKQMAPKPKPMLLARNVNAPAIASLTSVSATAVDRKLIKNAFLSVEVDDAQSAAQSITETTKTIGGYIADESRDKIGDERFQIRMTVRVPSETLDDVAENIQALGTVLSYNATAQDVTEEFFDTESRTRNLKKSEERLLDHLSRSAELEDILKAEQEITRVRGQIEQLEGRLRYLGNRVTFSSIVVTLQDKPGPEQVVPKESYSVLHEASQATRSVIGFGRELLTVTVWIVVWIPVWLPVLLVMGYFFRRLVSVKNTD